MVVLSRTYLCPVNVKLSPQRVPAVIDVGTSCRSDTRVLYDGHDGTDNDLKTTRRIVRFKNETSLCTARARHNGKSLTDTLSRGSYWV